MTTITNAENLRQYKIRFSLIVEHVCMYVFHYLESIK